MTGIHERLVDWGHAKFDEDSKNISDIILIRIGRYTRIRMRQSNPMRPAYADHMSSIMRIITLLIVLAMGAGCSRTSGLRARLFGNENTVPATELSMVPATKSRPEPAHRSRPQPRSTLLGSLPHSMTWHPIGESVSGRQIEAMLVGSGPLRVLLIGGIHGDEPEGLPLIDRLADEMVSNQSVQRNATVMVVRNLNPDG